MVTMTRGVYVAGVSRICCTVKSKDRSTDDLWHYIRAKVQPNPKPPPSFCQLWYIENWGEPGT